jgi:hypothetical protein
MRAGPSSPDVEDGGDDHGRQEDLGRDDCDPHPGRRAVEDIEKVQHLDHEADEQGEGNQGTVALWSGQQSAQAAFPFGPRHAGSVSVVDLHRNTATINGTGRAPGRRSTRTGTWPDEVRTAVVGAVLAARADSVRTSSA